MTTAARFMAILQTSSYKACAPKKNLQHLRATERPHMNIKVQTAFEHSLKVLRLQFI